MITIDIKNPNVRHFAQSLQNTGTNDSNVVNWRCLTAIFIIQFLYSQLVLSYGSYTLYLVQQNAKVMDALWPLIVYIGCCKMCNIWFQSAIESCCEKCFHLLLFVGTVTCSAGLSSCVFSYSSNLQALLYGVVAGMGTSIVMSLIRHQLSAITPQQSQLVVGVQHLGIALGLFATSHIIQMMLEIVSTSSRVCLLHGAIILHALPAGLMTYRKKAVTQELTVYVNASEIYEEEMTDMSSLENQLFNERNWKSPSDNLNFEENENEETFQENASPLPKHKTNLGVEVLPQIPEEDEEDIDDSTNIHKRNSMLLNDNIRKMSVISNQFEELIHQEEEVELTHCSSTSKSNSKKHNSSAVLQNTHETQYTDVNHCLCSGNCFVRSKTKYCLAAIIDMLIKPVFFSCSKLKFYPCLLTNIHSMLSPMIFFNFIALKAYHSMNLNSTESFFMFSITAFAYLAFIITLPWVVEIPKQYFKYLYISGCVISSLGVYLLQETQTDNYMTIGCLIYGFGFGIESYMKENVMADLLGAFKWSRIEGTLESFSGILFVFVLSYTKRLLNYEKDMSTNDYITFWLNVLLFSHLLIAAVWILTPFVSYLNKYKCKRNCCKF